VIAHLDAYWNVACNASFISSFYSAGSRLYPTRTSEFVWYFHYSLFSNSRREGVCCAYVKRVTTVPSVPSVHILDIAKLEPWNESLTRSTQARGLTSSIKKVVYELGLIGRRLWCQLSNTFIYFIFTAYVELQAGKYMVMPTSQIV